MSDFLTTWKRIVHDEHQAGTYWRVPHDSGTHHDDEDTGADQVPATD